MKKLFEYVIITDLTKLLLQLLKSLFEPCFILLLVWQKKKLDVETDQETSWLLRTTPHHSAWF